MDTEELPVRSEHSWQAAQSFIAPRKERLNMHKPQEIRQALRFLDDLRQVHQSIQARLHAPTAAPAPAPTPCPALAPLAPRTKTGATPRRKPCSTPATRQPPWNGSRTWPPGAPALGHPQRPGHPAAQRRTTGGGSAGPENRCQPGVFLYPCPAQPDRGLCPAGRNRQCPSRQRPAAAQRTPEPGHPGLPAGPAAGGLATT